MIDPDDIPVEPGAYAILVGLSAPSLLRIPRFAGLTLPSGRYAYCGSAYGPGGLRARIARHLRRRKVTRWHVDGLTQLGEIQGVSVRVGGNECDLVVAFASCGATVPLAGFGSSDCRRCHAHLLALPAGLDISVCDAVVNLGPATATPV